MNTFQYIETACKSPMNHIKTSRLPYHWDLNIYRGCEHNCEYCFAMYTHQYMDDTDFFHHIYVKTNIIEQLEKKLSSKTWKNEIINLGGVTDNYQNAEKQYKIMPEILKLMIKYKNPIIISTKSTLILRDIELLKQLSEVATVNIAFTITTLDEHLAKKIEPGASPPLDRLKALKKIKEETNAIIGIHMMPLIPYITATENNIDTLLHVAALIHSDYCIPSLLGLRGKTRTSFFQFLKQTYPTIYPKVYKLYQNKELKQNYKKEFYFLLNKIQKKYNISFNYKKPLLEKETIFKNNVKQLSIFDKDK